MKTLYLCGGINGLTDEQCNDWRQKVKAELAGLYHFLDPMRRDYRGKEDESVNEIVHGDYEDIEASDIILANCASPSWGTGMEIHHAFTNLQKRVLVVCPGRVSPWLRYHSERVFESLDGAIDRLRANAEADALAERRRRHVEMYHTAQGFEE